MSWIHLQRNNFSFSKTCSRRLQKVFAGRLKTSSRRPQDLLKTSLRGCLADMSWRRLWRQKTVALKMSSRCLQDIFTTSSPRRMFAGIGYSMLYFCNVNTLYVAKIKRRILQRRRVTYLLTFLCICNRFLRELYINKANATWKLKYRIPQWVLWNCMEQNFQQLVKYRKEKLWKLWNRLSWNTISGNSNLFN